MAEYRAIRTVFPHKVWQDMGALRQGCMIVHPSFPLNHCFTLSINCRVQDLRMNSTKSLIGHVLGGASGVEAVATIKAIQTGWLHPTINLESPEEVGVLFHGLVSSCD